MKKIIYLLLLCCPIIGYAQQINGTITHDGIERAYILYVPANYSAQSPMPLVFNFHGYTSNASEQMFYSNFNPLADAEGFIVAYPEGTLDAMGEQHFNAGWAGGTVDDLGFTSALIDSLSAEYSIIQERIYSTGMSNGGFMSYHLACNLSDRIAAIASVTGSMSLLTYNNCNSQRPVPIMQIHGTQDGVVPYNGNAGFTPIDNVISYWVDHNNCDATPTLINIPDTNTDDQCTAQHFLYRDGDNGVNVELFKIEGGGHTWPDGLINIPINGNTNRDINASQEIWNFFSKYDINGATITDVEESQLLTEVLVYPNPASHHINVLRNTEEKANFELVSTLGETVFSGILQTSNETLNVSQFPTGVYFLKLENHTHKVLMIND